MIDRARRQVERARSHGEDTRTSPALGGATTCPPPLGVLPGYTIKREIQRGAQGVVYLAIQEGTKRKVAIKVMREGPFAGPSDKARFEREIHLLAQLNHANIVTVHDSGSTVGGNYYFVMDYVDGQTLDACITGPQRPIDDVLRLFVKICDAVNAAHVRGVIHRDLKPSNIRIDSAGEPKVMDFGLAKLTKPDATDKAFPSVTTLSGQFVGSLPWASPEQAEGASNKIDVRTDVYSLGVILYQMLTGRFPYDVTGSMRDVLGTIIETEPVKPRTLRRQIGDDVETIVLKCLKKERDHRYQSAGELSRDIGRCLKGAPIEAKRDRPWYLMRKMIARYWFRYAAAAAAVLIVSASAYFVVRGRSAELTSWLGEARWALGEGEYETAIRFADRVLRRDPAHLEAGVVRIRSLMSRDRDTEAAQEARALLARHPEQAVPHFLLAELTRDSAPGESAEFQRRGRSLAKNAPEEYYLRAMSASDIDEAINLLSEAIELDPSYFEAILARVKRYYEKGDYFEARIDAEKGASLRPGDWRAWRHLGYIFMRMKDYKRAVSHLERTVDLKPDAESAWYNLGLAQAYLGRLAEAEGTFVKATELDASKAQAWMNLGDVQLRRGKTALARQSYGRAMDRDPQVHLVVFHAGLCEHRLGNYGAALELLTRAADLKGADLFRTYWAMGQSLAQLGRGAEALTAYEQALKEDPGNASVLNSVAMVRLTARSPTVQDFEQSLKVAREIVKRHADNLYFQRTLALAELRTGEFESAFSRTRLLNESGKGSAWSLVIGSWAAFECGNIELAHQWRGRAEAIINGRTVPDNVLARFLGELDARTRDRKETDA